MTELISNGVFNAKNGINNISFNTNTALWNAAEKRVEKTNKNRKAKASAIKEATKLGITENTPNLSEKIKMLSEKYGISYASVKLALFNMWKFGYIDGNNKESKYKEASHYLCSLNDLKNNKRYIVEDGTEVTWTDDSGNEFKVTFNFASYINERSKAQYASTNKYSELSEKDKLDIGGYYLRNSWGDTLKKFNISTTVLSCVLRELACKPKTRRGMLYTDASMRSASYVLAKRAACKVRKMTNLYRKNARLDRIASRMSVYQLAACYQAADNVLNGCTKLRSRASAVKVAPPTGARLRAKAQQA